jgi:hypothetical protein
MCAVLVGKAEGKGTLGRPRSRQEYNIKVDPKDICVSAKWI